MLCLAESYWLDDLTQFMMDLIVVEDLIAGPDPALILLFMFDML